MYHVYGSFEHWGAIPQGAQRYAVLEYMNIMGRRTYSWRGERMYGRDYAITLAETLVGKYGHRKNFEVIVVKESRSGEQSIIWEYSSEEPAR